MTGTPRTDAFLSGASSAVAVSMLVLDAPLWVFTINAVSAVLCGLSAIYTPPQKGESDG